MRIKIGDHGPETGRKGINVFNATSPPDYLVSVRPLQVLKLVQFHRLTIQKEYYAINSNPVLEGNEWVLTVPTFESLGFFINVYQRGRENKLARSAITSEELAAMTGTLKRPLIDSTY